MEDTEQPAKNALKFLVIEDSLPDFILLKTYLKSQGLEVNCVRAKNLSELRDSLKSNSWDVFLVDYCVPEMSFTDAMDLIREKYSDVPIIIVTGSLNEEQSSDLIKSGVWDVIYKNNMSRLISSIDQCLQKAIKIRIDKEKKNQNDMLASVIEFSPQPFAMGYLDGSLKLTNKAFEELTGYTKEELKTIDWLLTLTPPEWRSKVKEKAKELQITKLPVRYEKEYIRKDGTRVPVELLSHLTVDEDGNPEYYYSFVTDITDRKRDKEELVRLAISDPLTEILNRRHFLEIVKKEVCRSNRYSRPLSIIMFDLDHFKRINDNFGHSKGDEILKGVVSLIKDRLRLTDVFSRWGGEEFMILAPETSLNQAIGLAETLRMTLHNSSFSEVGSVTGSFGVVSYHSNVSMDQWLKTVDDLMYQSKKEGRNRISYRNLKDS